MKPVFRVVLYAALVAGAIVFGHRFLSGYARGVAAASTRYDTPEPNAAASLGSNSAPAEATNSAPAESAPIAPGGDTNAPATEAPNATASDLTNAPAASTTNASAAKPTRTSKPRKAARPTTAPAPVDGAAASVSRPRGSFRALDALLTLAAVVVLALMVARDVSHFIANRTQRALFNDEGDGIADPEYDGAEQVWANGEFLEAIRLLREYLAKNPRQIHVALRIAEIYEKDLNNHLAAALEYEEILQCRLDAERWGWAAIHLCNLYNRINQPDKAEALLRRIVEDYGDTAAAAKAREHLGISADQPSDGTPDGTAPADDGGFKLPPGFRPKKH